MITALALVASAVLAAALGLVVEHDRRWRLLWAALCVAALAQVAVLGVAVELRPLVYAVSGLAVLAGLACIAVAVVEQLRVRRVRRALVEQQNEAQHNLVRRWHGVASSLQWNDDEHGWQLDCQCGHRWVDPSIREVVQQHEQHVRQLQRLAATWGIDTSTTTDTTS